MKITVTYKGSQQIAPDDWHVFTEIIHLEPTLTLEQVYEIIAHKMKPGATEDFPVRVEIQFDVG